MWHFVEPLQCHVCHVDPNIYFPKFYKLNKCPFLLSLPHPAFYMLQWCVLEVHQSSAIAWQVQGRCHDCSRWSELSGQACWRFQILDSKLKTKIGTFFWRPTTPRIDNVLYNLLVLWSLFWKLGLKCFWELFNLLGTELITHEENIIEKWKIWILFA